MKEKRRTGGKREEERKKEDGDRQEQESNRRNKMRVSSTRKTKKWGRGVGGEERNGKGEEKE